MINAIVAVPSTDDGVDQFLEMAASANVFFEIISDHLIVRAVNPNWQMWKTIRHFLDEIGHARIEAYVRSRGRLVAR